MIIKSKSIQYETVVQSEAMSKDPKQIGLIISRGTTPSYRTGKWVEGEEVVMINAINPTTKKKTTHLEMQIPIENIDEVIEALKLMKND